MLRKPRLLSRKLLSRKLPSKSDALRDPLMCRVEEILTLGSVADRLSEVSCKEGLLRMLYPWELFLSPLDFSRLLGYNTVQRNCPIFSAKEI